MSACAKFEGCAGKTVGGIGFLKETGFPKKKKKTLLPIFTSGIKL